MEIKKSTSHVRLVTISVFLLILLMVSSSNVKMGYALTNVVVNEIEYNPAGTDAGHEWVELYNPTSLRVSLSGWTINTIHGVTYRVVLPSTASIGPYGYYVVGKST